LCKWLPVLPGTPGRRRAGGSICGGVVLRPFFCYYAPIIMKMKSVLKYLLLVLAFVPLIVDSSVFFPYITGKSMLIRIILAAVSVLYVGYFLYSRPFRAQAMQRIKTLVKNPLVRWLGAFMGVFLISTLFAVDKFFAFFGNVERAEGFVGMMFFFGFFVFALLLFERREWMWFFKLSIVTGFILFFNEMIQAAQGVVRPSSYTGNPIYIAQFFLFVIAAAALVILDAYRERRQKSQWSEWGIIWIAVSVIIIPLALLGISISETRGVIVGIGAGLVVALIYTAWRGKGLVLTIGKKINIRLASTIVLVLIVLFAGVFELTRTNPLWQHVPGVNRLADVSGQDPSTQTRLISLGVSLRAITPDNHSVGWEKFFIGWGPENFSIAYNHYYNPKYFEYEQQWFDRAHDKLMDVLVMNGWIGFIAYMGVWISMAWLLVKRKKFSGESAILLFFGAAYFVQNLTVFDDITTYIPLFGFWAFVAFMYLEDALAGNSAASGAERHAREHTHDASQRYSVYESSVGVVLGAMAIFYVVLLGYSLLGYYQMRTYVSALQSQDLDVVTQSIDSALYPYTFVQEDIRPNFLQTMMGLAGSDKRVTPLLEKAVTAMQELVQRDPYNPRYMIVLAQFYDAVGNAMSDPKYFALAQEQLDAARALAPDRQDIRDLYAYNLALQGKLSDAYALMEQTIALDPMVADPHYFYGILIVAIHDTAHYQTALNQIETAFQAKGYNTANNSRVMEVYSQLMAYFAQKRDAADFVTAATRLAQLDPTKQADYQQAIGYAQKGQWNMITIASGTPSASTSTSTAR